MLNKLTLVLLGLFMMMSSLVGVTAYVSNNQAYVKAQTTILVEFDTGFPGTSVTDSFTIENKENDNADYIINLDPPLGGELDMRPHLRMWKEPSEGEIDDYWDSNTSTGYGSFTTGSDTMDKWFATFDIPGDAVSADTGADYGCRIVISEVE